MQKERCCKEVRRELQAPESPVLKAVVLCTVLRFVLIAILGK